MIDIKLGTVSNAALAGKLIAGGWVSHPELLSIGRVVLQRYKFTCQGCGFQSRPTKQVPHGWMLPVDLQHPGLLALKEGVGICLCPLCASTLASNWSVAPVIAGSKELPAPGMLVLLPHISQVQLNRLALHLVSIHASRKVAQQTSLEAIAVSVDSVISSLSKDVQSKLSIYRDGKDAEFCRALSMLPNDYYQYRDEIIGPVRWWPTMAYWREQGAYWMTQTFDALQRGCPELTEAMSR